MKAVHTHHYRTNDYTLRDNGTRIWVIYSFASEDTFASLSLFTVIDYTDPFLGGERFPKGFKIIYDGTQKQYVISFAVSGYFEINFYTVHRS